MSEFGALVAEIAEQRGLATIEVVLAFEEAVKSVFPTADVEVVYPRGDRTRPEVVRWVTVGKGIGVAEAKSRFPESIYGDVVPVPFELGEGGKRRFRWLLNKHLAAAESEKLYRYWKGEVGSAALGVVRGPAPQRGVYVVLGDSTGREVTAVLERHRMTPGEALTDGLAKMFLVAAVRLRLATRGRLEIVVSRNSKRLPAALMAKFCPGVKIEVTKRIAGKRCVIVSQNGRIPRRVLAQISRLLGEYVKLQVVDESGNRVAPQKGRRRRRERDGAGTLA